MFGRSLRSSAAGAVACLICFSCISGHAHAQAAVYINTTVDTPPQGLTPCETGGICSLRRAIVTAQRSLSGAIVRACFDPLETRGASPCPPGQRPLRKADPGYDPRLDRWVFKLRYGTPIVMNTRQTFVDLRQGLTWESPADNKVIIDASGLGMDHAFAMESDRNILAGFEIRGDFRRAAILIRGGATRSESRNNQVGPGVIFANMSSGSGVHIATRDTSQNKIIGNWCGITGDGTQVSPLTDDCVYIEQGAAFNVIGDASPAGRNIFAATTEGSGVRIEDSEFVGRDVQSHDNVIEYNWFGLDAEGEATEGLDSGVVLIASPYNKVRHNLISNSRNAGIAVFDVLTGTHIADNIIGGGPDGESCRGNQGDGIFLVSGPSFSIIERNTIVCNHGNGITLEGPNTHDNRISRNLISAIRSKPISLISEANEAVSAPVIESVTAEGISGRACPDCELEIFSDNDRQAQFFEGVARADASGAFVFEKAGGFRGLYVTASTTKGLNSSELAAPRLQPGGRRRTPTLTALPPTWTPAFSATPGGQGPATATPAEPKALLHLPLLLFRFQRSLPNAQSDRARMFRHVD